MRYLEQSYPDPDACLGEAWCLTLAPISLESAFGSLGVVLDREARFTELTSATHAGAPPLGAARLLGKSIPGGACATLEVSARLGWLGGDPINLERLARGGVAGSAVADPDAVTVSFCEGDRLIHLDVVTGHLLGDPGPGMKSALVGAGLGVEADYGLGAPAVALTPGQRALLALQVGTGLSVVWANLAGLWVVGYVSAER